MIEPYTLTFDRLLHAIQKSLRPLATTPLFTMQSAAAYNQQAGNYAEQTAQTVQPSDIFLWWFTFGASCVLRDAYAKYIVGKQAWKLEFIPFCNVSE